MDYIFLLFVLLLLIRNMVIILSSYSQYVSLAWGERSYVSYLFCYYDHLHYEYYFYFLPRVKGVSFCIVYYDTHTACPLAARGCVVFAWEVLFELS